MSLEKKEEKSPYQVFSEYFNNPILVKTNRKDGTHCVYVAKINCRIGNAHHYLICVLGEDNYPVGMELPLSKLYWKSLQTRKYEHEEYKGGYEEGYTIDRCHEFYFENKGPLTQIINLIERKEKYTIYNASKYPMQIILYTTDGKYQYPEVGSIVRALKTYQTNITWV